jgi:hypothetical protein
MQVIIDLFFILIVSITLFAINLYIAFGIILNYVYWIYSVS